MNYSCLESPDMGFGAAGMQDYNELSGPLAADLKTILKALISQPHRMRIAEIMLLSVKILTKKLNYPILTIPAKLSTHRS